MKNAPQFRRGQVWYVDDNYVPIGSIQGKSRPYLVVSNDACNRFSPVIHMAPITSQPKKLSQPTHIKFFNPRRRQDNWILVEQSMPKSVPDIVDVSDYQYTLSADVMKEVDKALAIQFALKSFGVDVSEFETMLDMIVEQKIAQIQDATQSLMDARMGKYVNALLDRVADAGKIPNPQEYVPSQEVLAQMQNAPAEAVPPTTIIVPKGIEATLPDPPKPESKPKQDRPKSAIDRFNAKWGTQNQAPAREEEPKPADPQATSVERVEIVRTAKGRIRWSDELKRQFLTDIESYGPKKMAEIWDLSSQVQQQYKYKFQQELGTNPKETATRSTRKSKNSIEIPAPKSEILEDYDNMPISKFMEKYQIPTRSQAVELAAKLRIG